MPKKVKQLPEEFKTLEEAAETLKERARRKGVNPNYLASELLHEQLAEARIY
ncbi:MAG: hypothetical protein L6244_01630 [Candidatus Methanoperedenaceae archaeon]|nr:hypothetical protein [Euryarchaeota archaeon]MCG2727338.1 hypothetical protein [Candidatus Methanoperedenaceae archaeon]